MTDKVLSLPEKSGYRIIRQLGSGGDGTVYLVCHLSTEQLRAAKVLTNVRTDRRHELDMMKHLNHPGLPKVIDLLEQDESIWLIMEYIQGERLDQEVSRGITKERLWSVACQLAEILMYLHSRNPPILHLDIKPSNILVRPDKSLVLIDFGASIRGDLDGKQYKRYGTRGFAAPEQSQKDGSVDERTDIFGVGAVLHYCYYRKAPDEWKLKKHAPEMESGGMTNRPKSGVPACICGFHRKKGQKQETSSQRWFCFGKKCLSDRKIDRVISNCIAEDPAFRYQNSQQLYKAVCHADQADRRCRQLYKAVGSMVLLILVSLLLVESVSKNGQADEMTELSEAAEHTSSAQREEEEAQSQTMEQIESEEQEYHRLLAMAGGMGLSQAAECYQKAASLCPADGEWYLQLVDQVIRDGLFEVEEENIVKDLIYTVQPASGVTALELLEKNQETYGLFTYRLGLAYWYFYAESGGKNAAAWWFGLAVSAKVDGEHCEWMEMAEVLARIGSYYGMLSSTERDEEREEKEWEYWKDLKVLWYLYRENQENTLVCAEAASELFSFLILKSSVVCQNGESEETTLQLIESIGEFVQSGIVSDDKKREELVEQYAAARSAVERAFQGQEESEE